MKDTVLIQRPREEILTALKVLTGLSWTLAYILIIKRGFEDATFGMPMVALSANVAWEFIFSFVYPHRKAQRTVNIIWFLFDLVIVFQFLWYGKADPAYAGWPDYLFYLSFLTSLVIAFFIILLMTQEFNDRQGKFSASGQNLMMSILFISMLMSRGSVAGQSIHIALAKMIGTLIPSIAIYLWYPSRSQLIGFLGLTTFIFDLIYFFMIYQTVTALGLNPWSIF